MKKKKPNLILRTFNNLLVKPIKKEISKELNKQTKLQKETIQKELSTPVERENPNITSQAMQFSVNPNIFNSVMRPNIKDKPEGYINPLVLRNFSVDYPIARACIDYIKTKTTQLEWEIVKENEEDKMEENDIVRKNIEDFFARPSGKDTTMRIFLEQIIEDYLVMGAVTIEKLKTRGGNILHLLPVDAGTIKVRVDDSGRIPNSPSIAFEQWIRGVKVAELTKDDLLFAVKNARPNTIFGLSPLESLIIQVQSALAGSLYNWKFFTDSNLAEGFIEVPEDWTKDQVAEFQSYFDAMVAGDPRYQRRLKMMPGGMKYTPTKKPEDMAFERFELWLLQQTCAVFGVTPQSLGFTQQVNKATAEVQGDITQERVGRGLQQFIEEMFTNLIQYEMGYSDYKFVFINSDPTDLLEEAQIDDIRIKSGVISVDEVRRRNGMDEIGLGHYIMGTPTMATELLTQQATQLQNAPQVEIEVETEGDQMENEMEDDMGDSSEESMQDKLEKKELTTWKKYCINAIKSDRKIGDFKVYHIEKEIEKEIKSQLIGIDDKASIVEIFRPYITSEYRLSKKFRKILDELNQLRIS